MKQEEEKNENGDGEPKANRAESWLPELSFTTVLSIVGIGFTAFDMFMRYRQSLKEDNKNRIVSPTRSVEPAPPNIPTQPSQPLKMGMI